MKEVSNYKVFIYGKPNGYQNTRARIYCYGKNGTLVAILKFLDPDMPFRDDYELGRTTHIHIPSCRIEAVLDTLRNEKPIYIHFVSDTGAIATSKEPTGEEESDRRG